MTPEMILHFGGLDMVYGISVQNLSTSSGVLLYITHISEAESWTLQFWFDSHSVGILIWGCFPDKHLQWKCLENDEKEISIT